MAQKEKGDYLLPDVQAAEAQRRLEAAERSRANLRPWQAGQSGNVAGRRASGAYVKEAINVLMMVDENGPRYSLDEIEEMTKDHSNGPAYIMAAQRIRIACQDPAKYVSDEDGHVWYAGSDSEPGRAFEQVADRLEGKPVATVHVHHADDTSPDDLRRELLTHLTNRPGLLRFLMEQISSAAAAGTLPPPHAAGDPNTDRPAPPPSVDA